MDMDLLLRYSQCKSICHRKPNLQFHFDINLSEDGHGFIASLVNVRTSVIENLTFSFTFALIYLKMDMDLLLRYSQRKNICHKTPNLQFHFGINLPEDGHGFIALLQSM